MYIIFYGPEGSGKSTQAKLLANKLNLPYLGSGDLVRKYADEDKGVIGDVCRRALRIGKYVPDSEMFVLWKKRLKEKDVQNGWILDGFPRNPQQAEFLDNKLDKYGKKINHVFYLQVREKISIKRLLKRGRKNPDGTVHDTKEKIRERLRLYKQGEIAVLELYKKNKVLKCINGEQSIVKIHQEIISRLKKEDQNKCR